MAQVEETKKRSYKEFEKDYFAHKEATENFINKHGDVLDDIRVFYKPNSKNGFNLGFQITTKGKEFHDTYDMLT